MANDKRLVTIIIPTFNSANTIKRCVDSVLSQDYINLEIIIVDDGSSDDTVRILKDYYTDSRINVVELQHKGVSFARNFGIKKSTGKYIMFMDSDDTLVNNAISSLLSVIEKKKVDIVKFGYYEINDKTKKTKTLLGLSDRNIGLNNKKDYDVVISNCFRNEIVIPCFSVTLFIKKDFIMKNAIKFDESKYIMEDALFHLDIFDHGAKIFFYDEPLYNVYINNNSVTRSDRALLRSFMGITDSANTILSRIQYDGDAAYKYFHFLSRTAFKYIYKNKKTNEAFFCSDAKKIIENANLDGKKKIWKITREAFIKKKKFKLFFIAFIYCLYIKVGGRQ